jgi:predicted dehydrogenase
LVTQDRNQLGIVLHYGYSTPELRTEYVPTPKGVHASGVGRVTIGLIGAGAFAKGVLIPAFCRTAARLECIASASGLSAAHAARKFGVAASTSNYRHILENDRINTVVITTRHHQHAPMVAEALAA